MSKEKTNREKNEEDDSRHVARGGSWKYGEWDSRVSFRGWDYASFRNRDLGFRLVLQTKEKK